MRHVRAIAALGAALVAAGCGGEAVVHAGSADETAPNAGGSASVADPPTALSDPPPTLAPALPADQLVIAGLDAERGEIAHVTLHLEHFLAERDLYASAVFGRSAVAPRLHVAALERCTDEVERFRRVAFETAEAIDAGEQLLLRGAAGTLGTVDRSASAAGYYATRLPDFPPPSEPFVASVPDERFAALERTAVAPLEPMNLLEPRGEESLAPGATLRWVPDDDPATYAVLRAHVSAAGSAPTRSIACHVRDDGVFALPAVFRETLPPGTTLSGVTLARVRLDVRVEGDTLVEIESASTASVADVSALPDR